MRYEWDEAKREVNLAKHGIDFTAIELFEWETATVFEDRRKDYDEKRMVAVVFTQKKTAKRIISLRKANNREVNHYG